MAKYELTVTHHYKDNEKAPGAKDLQNYIDSVLSESSKGWDAVSATLMVSDSELKATMYSGQVFNTKAKQDGEKHRQWPWRCSADQTPDVGYEDVVIAAEYDPRFGWHNVGSYEYDQERKLFISEDDENPIILKPGQSVWWRFVQLPDFVPPQNKPITNKNE